MGALTFGNADKQQTLTVNKNDTASGSAVINKPVTRGSGNTNLRLQRGATYDARVITNVQGIDESRLQSILESVRLNPSAINASAPTIPSTGGTAAPGTTDPVRDAINERIAGNVAEGTPDSKGTIKTVLLVAGAGLLLLVSIVGVGMLLLRKKKGAS